MNPHLVPQRDTSLQALELDGEVLLYDGRQLRFLDGPAAAVWGRVDGVTTAGDLATAVAEQFPDQRSQAELDALAFVGQLERRGLVKTAERVLGPVYRKAPDVALVRDDDVILLLRLTEGTRRALSVTATRIWDLVLLGTDVEDVVLTLQEEYPDAPSSLPSDVRQLLAELVAAGLLVLHR